jgi:hypothetical protein
VVSTSNPTAAFSAFQTGMLLLYSTEFDIKETNQDKITDQFQNMLEHWLWW